MIDIGEDLSKIASMLAKTALSDLITEERRQEIFKLLTTYHLGICKVDSKKAAKEDDDDTDTFDQFRQRVSSAAGGNGEDHPS